MTAFSRFQAWFRRHRPALEIWSLVVIGSILYANCLPNKLFWDDNDFFINNKYVHEWRYFGRYFTDCLTAGAGILIDYWRPVLLMIWSVAWHLWRDWAPGYHLLSVTFHVASAVLLLRLLDGLFRDRRLAWLTALVFLVHPLQTEAVVNASGLGDPVSVFFILACLHFFIRFRTAGRGVFGSRFYWLSLLVFILALMSKETAIVIPGLIIITDAYLSLRDRPVMSWKTRLSAIGRVLWPYFVLAGIYVLLRATVLNFVDTFNLFRETNTFTSTFHVRLLTFFSVLTRYVGLLFAPFGLHMERNIAFVTSPFDPLALAGAAISAGLLTAAVSQWRRRPVVSYGILWFFIGLAPVSNLLTPISGLMYEHWLYLPLIGFFLALVWCSLRLTDHFGFRKPALVLAAAIIIFLSVLTVARNADWRDPIIFYGQVLKFSPDSYRIVSNMGAEYSRVGDFANAIKTFARAIEIEPKSPIAYHNIANVYRRQGDGERAMEYYRQALELDPGNRILYNAPLDYLLKQGNYRAALRLFEGYLPYAPTKVNSYYVLIKIAMDAKDLEAALGYLEQAAAAAPDDVNIRNDIESIKRMIKTKL